MSSPPTVAPSGTEIIRQFIPASPFVRHLGIEVLELGDGEATLGMPFREELVTIGQVVHGGALGALVDTAVMAAAWSGAEPPEQIRGATVDLSLAYLAPAQAEDVVATARVLRRGRRLVSVAVDVHTAAGAHVVHAVATYQIG
jgi:uncharacterized protein (TIGR00369 family)